MRFAVLRTKAEPPANRTARRGQCDELSIDLHPARLSAVDAKKQSRRFGASRAQQSGQSHHFAGANRQIEWCHRPAPSEPDDPQKRLLRRSHRLCATASANFICLSLILSVTFAVKYDMQRFLI